MTPRTLGVVGTLVWDCFPGVDDGVEPMEDWGGIAYALAALSSTLPPTWSVRPIVKLGADLAVEGRRFVHSVPRIDDSALMEVAEANNRVELRYVDAVRRTERLSGGVPPWSWKDLAPRLRECDALYVNFISGYEMDVDTAKSMSREYAGPVYADLHSLFLARDDSGLRVPRALPEADRWFGCFDALQLNEDELALLDTGPLDLVGADGRPVLIAVTRGPHGAECTVGHDVGDDPTAWVSRRSLGRPKRAPARSVTVATRPRSGDPTGCGDVWGATVFSRLLAGDALRDAMATGNDLAGQNVQHRGASGFMKHLRATAARAR